MGDLSHKAAPVVGLVVALASADVTAAPPRAQDRGPTDGVDRLYHDYAGEGDASSLELNPAMLSAIKGLDFVILGYQAVSELSRGTGVGAFWAANLFGALALGFGVQSLDPGLGTAGPEITDFDAANNPSMTKISFALSGGDREHGAFGVGIHGVRTRGEWIQRPDVDLGAMVRIGNHGGVGFSSRFTPANLSGEELPAEIQLAGELAIRPLGTHHVEIAGGLRSRLFQGDLPAPLSNQARSGVLGRARIAVRHHGWALKGEAEQIRTVLLDADDDYSPIKDEKAWRGSIALEAAWDFVTVGSGVHVGPNDDVAGVGYMARFSTARQGRVYWPRRIAAERLDVSKVGDEHALIRMLRRIDRAASAGRRSILLVDARETEAGWAQLHELRQALIRVRNAGGHVFAYVEGAGLKDYYLASVAEKVYIHPAGELGIYGISSSTLYFRSALAKIGVRAEGLAIKEYKSAHERFSRDAPSEHDVEQRMELLRDTYGLVVRDIAQARGLDLATVRGLVDDAPHGPEQAVERGLVDKVLFRDQVIEEISEAVGATVHFAELDDTTPEDLTWGRHPYIAVVVVEGTISEGDSSFIPFLGLRFAGSDTIAKALRQARSDPACKGVILRVNSPGGSALASDVIWREAKRTDEAFEKGRHDPPIVVSMSDVAGSGGYYIAMGASTIVASPVTVTGSIGVVSLHFDVSGLLRKLGISQHTFKQGKNPDIGQLWRPYTADQRKRVEASMQRTYDLFRRRVSDARGMTMEKVDELGRGHVYSGQDAKDLGLVDELGGLHEAIAIVRKQAGIRPFRRLELRVMPKKLTLLDLLLENLGNPFADNGAVGRKLAERRARKTRALPLALDKALARIPLSLLYLPSGKASVIMPGLIELTSSAASPKTGTSTPKQRN